MGSKKMVYLNAAPLPVDLIPTLDDSNDNEVLQECSARNIILILLLSLACWFIQWWLNVKSVL